MKESIITNFNVPKELRMRFDLTCRISGKTRTAALIELMENYILSQSRILADRDKELAEIDKKLAKARRGITLKEFQEKARRKCGLDVEPDSDEEPLPFFLCDGHEEW